MNNKGFTLVEVIVTFALSTVIILILMNILLLIKDSYVSASMKSSLIVEQGNLSNVINTTLSSGIMEISTCTDSAFCYEFVLTSGENVKLSVINNSISFGNYTYNLNNSSKVETPELITNFSTVSSYNVNDGLLVINIPIKCNLYPKQDFGVSYVYQFKQSELTIR